MKTRVTVALALLAISLLGLAAQPLPASPTQACNALYPVQSGDDCTDDWCMGPAQPWDQCSCQLFYAQCPDAQHLELHLACYVGLCDIPCL